MADIIVLTDKDAIKAILHMTASTDDTLITTIATYVRRWVQNYCGRKLEPATQTDEEYNGNGSDALYLRQYPIIGTPSVKENNVALASAVFEDSYRSGINHETGKLQRIDGVIFTKGIQNYKISYSSGWADLTTVIELVQVTTQLGVDMYNESLNAQKGGSGKISSERMGNYQVSFQNIVESVLTPAQRAVLDTYKRLI